jgi:hypothetical protein
MKKLFLYTFALLATAATVSCSDKDEASYEASSDRLMRPIFRTNLTVQNGSNDPYLCKLIGGDNGNTIQLYWSRINGATGYRIKASYNQSVATGDMTNWNDPKYLVLDTIIKGQEQDQLLLKDLEFSKTYRFAISAISDRGEEHNSEWFGIGDLRHWADYCAISTGDRYEVPSIIYQKGDITKSGFTIYLDRSYAKSGNTNYKADQLELFDEHFNTETDQHGNKVWKVNYLVIEASQSNPNATVPDKYKKLQLTSDMFDENGQAKVIVEGLDSNSVYSMYVYDDEIYRTSSMVYAQYNLDMTVRTKGDPGAPIIFEPAAQDTMHYWDGDVEKSINLPAAATPIQPLLEKFMKDNQYAENQVFYLRGDQIYYTTAGLNVFKGFKLATHPDDVAAGKRAKVYLYHQQVIDISTGKSPSPAFFMLGRQPEGGENPMITIDIDKIQFEDIDFAIPMARNIGDGSTIVTNSYFMNMYSGGMGAIVEGISLKNCSFQGIVGGFYRVQANYGVRIKEFTIDNVDFYNGGYYNANGRRYNWFHANPEANKRINIWEKFIMRNCTIYDNALGYMFNHNKQQSIEWDDDLHYNITLENNTFVNFNTCNVGNSMLFNTRWIPGGSTFTLKRNLFVLTRQANDELRTMVQAGCDVRTINGSGKITLDFEDNYSTNDNLTNGQIFSNTASAFDYTAKNTFGSFADEDITWGAAGRDGLTVKVAEISATDLMVQPNPPHILTAEPSHWDHQEDGIDGTVTNVDAKLRSDYVGGMVDLHFKNFDNVLVEKNVGAPKWRQR